MKDWHRTLISPTTSIRRAIEVIDEGSLQIAFVTDETKRLLGTVTDGDVRRGILRGVSLDDPVEKIMRQKPLTATQRDKRDSILALMQQRRIHQVPILDEGGRIMSVEVLDEMLAPQIRDNWVVIMAGGLGSRLRPLTDNCPKPLLHVGNKPILETILENFIEYGFRKFFLSVNYKDEMVREYFGDGSRWKVEIQYLQESQKLGTAGALSLLPPKASKPILVMNGDLLTKINFSQLLEFHAEHKAGATMCIREYDFQVPYGVVRMDNHLISGIDEKPIHRFFVNAGIYVLDPGVFKFIPKNSHLDMPNLFEKLIQDKFSVAAFPIREYWLDIGHMDDFERANSEFSSIFKK